ncbi:MAG: DUF721 domain-containing protein [Gemmatimonadota bacterium]
MAEGKTRTSGRSRGRGRGTRPEALGDLVTPLLDRLGIAEKVERAAAVAEWDRIVGPHIARVARPVRVHETTLFVEVESAAWRMELNMMRRDIIGRINAGREGGRIERIVFVQSDGELPEPARPEPKEPGT